MKILILLRHAKSDWHSAAQTDFERPLNARGEKAAPLMGQRLIKRGCSPERLISSPAKRAMQTAKKVAKEIDYPERQIEYREEIYEASRKCLLRLVQELHDRDGSVLLVGHNPGFSQLGEWLCPEAPDWLPTCGLLEFELPIDDWAQVTEGCAQLQYFDYPKKAD